MRVRNKSNSNERLENSDLVFVKPDREKVNFSKIFNNDNPIHLEIGSGKGKFIYNMAKKHPNINFLALEAQPTVLSFILDKQEKEKQDNLLLIQGDANYILEYFSENSVDKIYLNFSDPWPKTRHEKRRLTFKTFLSKYEYILKNDKNIAFKTDNMGLFEYSLKSLTDYGFSINELSLNLTNSKFEEENIHTEYEDKFIAKGDRIYYVNVSKTK